MKDNFNVRFTEEEFYVVQSLVNMFGKLIYTKDFGDFISDIFTTYGASPEILKDVDEISKNLNPLFTSSVDKVKILGDIDKMLNLRKKLDNILNENINDFARTKQNTGK